MLLKSGFIATCPPTPRFRPTPFFIVQAKLPFAPTALASPGIIPSSSKSADFEEDGIIPGEARAVGAKGNLAWTIKKGVGLNLGVGGQVAMNPLFNSMTFGLGSNAGIKGLPGSLTSGDSGWLGTSELVLTAWQKNKKAFQVVPFIGAGGVHTDLKGVKTKDAVGAPTASFVLTPFKSV